MFYLFPRTHLFLRSTLNSYLIFSLVANTLTSTKKVTVSIEWKLQNRKKMTLLPPISSTSVTVRVLSAALGLSGATQSILSFVLCHEALVFNHLFSFTTLAGILGTVGGAFVST